MSETQRPAEAPVERPLPQGRLAAALLLALLVPGAGHVLLGRRARGLVFLGIVLCSLLIGLSLEGNLYRPVAGQPLTRLATAGSMGMGVAYFVLRWGLDYTGSILAPGYEYGTAFILTAGLMNLLLVLDVWDLGRGRKE